MRGSPHVPLTLAESGGGSILSEAQPRRIASPARLGYGEGLEGVAGRGVKRRRIGYVGLPLERLHGAARSSISGASQGELITRCHSGYLTADGVQGIPTRRMVS